jgi:hypothetical protein
MGWGGVYLLRHAIYEMNPLIPCTFVEMNPLYDLDNISAPYQQV